MSEIDFTAYWMRLKYCLGQQGNLVWEELGTVGNMPINLIMPRKAVKGPKILIAAGFHGDEAAGCYGVLRFLETIPVIDNVNVSFLPIVNPTGFCLGTREGFGGKDPNRGFVHQMDVLSDEGKILLQHESLLTQSCAADGFLSLHEDRDAEEFYMYTFEKRVGKTTSLLSRVRPEILRINECDGSYEDYLNFNGVPYTVTTEVPGSLNWNSRVDFHAELINNFIKLMED